METVNVRSDQGGSDGEQRRPPELYHHEKRPQWGMALLVWERADKRGYQFEDGTLRTIKRGFYHFLKQVDVPRDRANEIGSRLQRKLGISQARRDVVRKATRRGEEAITFQEQMNRFRDQYPDGFTDDGWIKQVRGDVSRRPLKRHRDPSIENAQREWAAPILDERRAAGDSDSIWQAIIEVLDGTDLVRPGMLAKLRAFEPADRDRLAGCFRELLYGEGPLTDRMDEYIELFGEDHCQWQLATAPLALMYPTKHVCVRPTSFRRQAQWMAPGLTYEPVPSGAAYRRWRQMARAVFEQLTQAGYAPQDMMDVYDFIRITLKPSQG